MEHYPVDLTFAVIKDGNIIMGLDIRVKNRQIRTQTSTANPPVDRYRYLPAKPPTGKAGM